MIVVVPEDKKTHTLGVPLTEAMHAEVQEAALERGVTRAVLVRQLVREWLERQAGSPVTSRV
jgi:hypothetical protein